jgi:hypothetical protein
MDRRTFLRRGVFGGAILLAGGATIHLWPVPSTYAPRQPLLCVDARGFAILAAIAARTVHDPIADPVEVAHAVDATMALAVPEAQDDLRRVLALFESGLVGLLFDRRVRPFTRLDPEAQDAVLAAWRDSALVLRRGGYQALRKLTLAAHYASPRSWEGVGYGGPPEIAGG